jgi:hypothetical protein
LWVLGEGDGFEIVLAERAPSGERSGGELGQKSVEAIAGGGGEVGILGGAIEGAIGVWSGDGKPGGDEEAWEHGEVGQGEQLVATAEGGGGSAVEEKVNIAAEGSTEGF